MIMKKIAFKTHLPRLACEQALLCGVGGWERRRETLPLSTHPHRTRELARRLLPRLAFNEGRTGVFS